MKEIIGSLNSLGNSQIILSNINSGVAIYSTIEIGDKVLEKIAVQRSLDNFLQRGLSLSGNVKLYIVGSQLLGIELPDGKSYYQKARNLRFFCALLLPFILTFASGLIFITDGQRSSQARNWSMAFFIPFGIMSLVVLIFWWRQYSVARLLKSRNFIGISA